MRSFGRVIRNTHQGNPNIRSEGRTYVKLLQGCRNSKEVNQVHGGMVMRGIMQDVYLGTTLVNMYAKCETLVEARLAFDQMPTRNLFSWNSMIASYTLHGLCDEALAIYWQMQRAGFNPDNFTFPCVLKACAGLAALQEGREIHGCVIKSGFESDLFVGSALVAMYAKCRNVENARQMFDKISRRDLVSWNAMVASYNQNGYCAEALEVFRQMELAGTKPDSSTVVSILPACAGIGALQQGKEIHAFVVKTSREADAAVANALIAMYGKCGFLDDARNVFDKMPERDAVSWNAMIAAYAQNGYCEEALELFGQMELSRVKPDPLTFVSVLPACAQKADLQRGKEIHEYILGNGFETDILVTNALIDMYAKCERIGNARQLFDNMFERDIISWNAMIAGYVKNGNFDEAVKLFCQMELAGIAPDSVTIVSLLCSCARSATMQQGEEIHNYIIRNGFESQVFVLNALIDTYAKCGSIENARQLFDKMCQRDVVSWTTMIVGYGMHGHGVDALTLFYKMQQAGMKPDHITLIAVLVACSHGGLVHEGWHYFSRMSEDYCIIPRAQHYACMVDLLGRSGNLDEAYSLIKKMPLEPTAGVWGALLGACRIHRNVELGERAAKCLFELEPENTGYYVLLSNIYAAVARWDGMAKVRKMMKDRGLKKNPGCSWIEIANKVHVFLGGDRSHPQSEQILAMLESLVGQMEEAGYVPDTNFVLDDMEFKE